MKNKVILSITMLLVIVCTIIIYVLLFRLQTFHRVRYGNHPRTVDNRSQDDRQYTDRAENEQAGMHRYLFRELL